MPARLASGIASNAIPSICRRAEKKIVSKADPHAAARTPEAFLNWKGFIMVYIVIDLEWNQCSKGKTKAVPGMPFEIIEIGAVKLNENRQVLSRFQQLVRPKVYKKLHFAPKELLHISERDLKHGIPFPEAMKQFLSWCAKEGKEYHFCTWGAMDLTELQRNCHYYGIEDCFPNPLFYYDLQKNFCAEFGEGQSNLSLEHALERLSLKKGKQFHRALADAEYTAKIFQKLSMKEVEQYYSVDYYQLPENKKQELHMEFPTYIKHVSRKYETREKALNDRTIRTVYCPKCGKRAVRKIRWYTSNMKNYYSLSECMEHGYIRGRLRLRKTDDGKYYIIKTLRPIQQEEAQEMRHLRERLKKKKKKPKS